MQLNQWVRGAGSRPPIPSSKAIRTNEDAIKVIGQIGSSMKNRETVDAKLLDLLEYLWENTVQVSVSPSASAVVNYVVTAAQSSGIRFNPEPHKALPGALTARVPALVVPMISENSLVAGDFPAPTTANGGKGWASLDLANPSALFIATSQLSGCSFLMGWDNKRNMLYMGHAQPAGGRSRADLAKHLRDFGGFQGVPGLPRANLFVFGGDELGYGQRSANILGIVSDTAVSFIIQEIDHTFKVVNTRIWKFDHKQLPSGTAASRPSSAGGSASAGKGDAPGKGAASRPSSAGSSASAGKGAAPGPASSAGRRH